ncbi:Hydroquinone glucosyltransferase [Morus notabilis]|uniref:Hydroquinone glucosyltransferase n=1 Tax=Morus notabilis TaxID=981085 RepID=W9SEK9_9ROSA|nr:Hydroquinone glucosyltransferase [Morus notabilis]
MEGTQKNSSVPHIAIVPTPGMGHLFPLIEFAKRLVVHHEVAIIFIVPNDGSSMELQKKLLQSLPKPISYVLLPPVNFDDLTEDSVIETRIELTLTRSLPALRESLKAIMAESTRLVALVVDVFGPSAFDVARELGIPPYIFFPTTAMVLSFFFYLPKLDAITSSEYRDLPEPISLPGCTPVKGRDLFSPLHNRKTEIYKSFVRMADRYNLASGIMVNSFMELEPGTFKALKERIHGNPSVYPVGPMIHTGSRNGSSDEPECLSWLDKQPNGSVMFVSFGSGGTLTQAQLTELAFGLETSGQRFLWVLKSPNEKSADAAFFSLKSTKNPFDYLASSMACL